MGRHRLENLNRPFIGGDDDGGGDGVEHTHDSGGANEVLSNIYRNDASASCVGNTAAGYKFARNDLQTLDIFPSSNSTVAFNSSGVMASSEGLAFTSAQWKELERQTMIFKYLTASVPLPHDLRHPFSLNFPAPASGPSINLSGGELYNARYFKNRDPEPGRCKRTDGKKWRCSKEVAPLQKYCERHLQKGRSRSRKPVEVRNNSEIHKKTRLEQTPLPTLQAHSTASHPISTQNEPHLLFNPMELKSDRDASLMMELKSTENNWQHLMKKANVGFLANEFSFTCSSNPFFHQDCVETSNPLSFSTFQEQTEVIDAWPGDNYENSKNGNATSYPVFLHQGNVSPSLNLSMVVAPGNVLDGETSKFEGGTSLKDSDDCYITDTRWLPISRGGPLGEALQPLLVGVEGSNPASPHDSVHTTVTTVSSPSGVLHRTLFSHSENSVCNSPARAAPSLEYPFQWFS